MRISVIVATWNRSHVLGEAIGSILAQTRPADEIVVVDDGSTDDTQARLAALAAEPLGDRIVALRQDNAGVAAARNAGLARASGDWIAFLDDDDVWDPGRLAILERDLAADGDGIEVHVANIRYVGEGYAYDQMAMLGVVAPEGRSRRVADVFVPASRGFQLNGLACTRRLARAIGGFEESLQTHEDKLFTGLLGLGRPWLVTGDTVSEVRRLEGDTAALTAVSSRNAVRRWRGMLHVNDRFLELAHAPAHRRHLLGSRNFMLLGLAEALAAEGDRAGARSALLEAARCHPSPARGWVKSLPPLLLGRAGFRLARARQTRWVR